MLSAGSKNRRTLPSPSNIQDFLPGPSATLEIGLTESFLNSAAPLVAKLCNVASSISPVAEGTRRTSRYGTMNTGIAATVLADSACQTPSASS